MKKDELGMNFYCWLFFGNFFDDCIWIRCRFIPRGISVLKTEKLFSERNGNVKSIPLFKGWRIKII